MTGKKWFVLAAMVLALFVSINVSVRADGAKVSKPPTPAVDTEAAAPNPDLIVMKSRRLKAGSRNFSSPKDTKRPANWLTFAVSGSRSTTPNDATSGIFPDNAKRVTRLA